jgi:uncharacterized membrane protein
MSFLGKKKALLSAEEQQKVVACIQEAENRTTGEIRVYMESKCSYIDAMERAKELFESLGMTKTERRNAVLIYLATEDRQFAVAGDTEIYEKAGGPVFWESAALHLQSHLKEGRAGEGLCACVNELGNALANHFPYDPTITKNELPDEIVFGK